MLPEMAPFMKSSFWNATLDTRHDFVATRTGACSCSTLRDWMAAATFETKGVICTCSSPSVVPILDTIGLFSSTAKK